MLTIKKLFLDYAKEEKWINDMVQKGYAFKNYTFPKYTFEDCKPGEYIYRLQMLEKKLSHPESVDYLEFTKDMNVEIVGTYVRWVYFRKKAADGPFEIFSDVASKIKYHKTLMTTFGIISLSNILIAMSNLLIGLFTKFNLFFVGINGSVAILLGILVLHQYKIITELRSRSIN